MAHHLRGGVACRSNTEGLAISANGTKRTFNTLTHYRFLLVTKLDQLGGAVQELSPYVQS